MAELSASFPFQLHELTGLHDPYLIDWVDLYEAAFPPEERSRLAYHLRTLQARERGEAVRSRLWALLQPGGQFLGMAQTSWNPDYCLAYLGYIAVLPAGRGQGAGSAFYRALLPLVQEPRPDFMLFDVERPDAIPDPEARSLAARRIAFYERLGAFVLPGVTFYWGKAVQRLMAHSFTEIKLEEVIARARALMKQYGGELREDE